MPLDGTPKVPLGYATVAPNTASALPSVPAGATQAELIAEAGSIRLRDDGTAPTGTTGWLLPPGVRLIYSGTLASLQMIQASGSAGTVHALYYR